MELKYNRSQSSSILLCFRISTEDVRHNTPLHFHMMYSRFNITGN
jgi:hypothetical protein